MPILTTGNVNGFLTYSAPSTKWILGRTGVYESGTALRCEFDASGTPLGIRIEEARTNLFLNSRAPVTQNITVAAGSYTVSGLGAVGATLTLSGAATGTLTGTAALGRDSLTVTTTAGTLTVTVVGTWDFVQIELGAFMTSPIVTAGSTVTRAADNITLATSLFPVNAAPLTLIARVRPFVQLSPTARTALAIGAGVNAQNVCSISYRSSSVDDFNIQAVTGGTLQLAIAGGAINVAGQRCGAAFATNDTVGAVDGVIIGSDTTCTFTTYDALRFGSLPDGSARLNGHLREVMVLPRRMSDAQLQAVTV